MIALYVRLSQADHDKAPDDESSSIEHQIMVLTRFVNTLPEYKGSEVKVFKDDGYSGTNFKRPGFEEMMELVYAGVVECVIVKDNSRFGRNYIEAGNLIENILPSLNVRYISVLDGYDSNDRMDEASKNFILGFENILNASYSKQLSRSIKAARTAAYKKGNAISSHVLFGYVFDKNAKGNMRIDEEAAAIIRRIFDLVCDDKSIRQIVDMFNAEGVPTIIDYKQQKGLPTIDGHGEHRTHKWNPTSINTIIGNEGYIGTFIGNKAAGKSKCYSNGYASEEGVIKIENAHEAIVSRDTFLLANSKINRYTLDAPRAKPTYGLFSGLVHCGICGKTAIHKRNSKREVTAYFVNCDCGGAKVKDKDLRTIVNATLERYLQSTDITKGLLIKTKKLQTERLQNIKQDISTCKLKKGNCASRKLCAYEDYSKQKIKTDEYLYRKELINKEAIELNDELAALNKRLASITLELEQTEKDLATCTTLCTKHACQLCDSEIRDLIDCIELHPDGSIEINFAFQDLFERAYEEASCI